MTNTKLIQTIRNEIERLIKESDFDESANLYSLLSFLSTLESEKPIDIDFEQELYNRFGMIKDFTLGMRIAQCFYDLGCRCTAERYDEIEYNRQRAEESLLPEDTVLFNKGVAEGKRLMMEGAIKGEICHLGVDFLDYNISELDEYIKQYKVGDKVRIIIVKEDGK